MRWWGSSFGNCVSPSSPFGLRRAPASSFGLCAAAPRVAKRAKAGGARRDRTADLLHAMQALSQLSYGPVTCFQHDPAWGSCRTARPRRLAGQHPDHRSGLISSLFVAADVADDVGDVLIAFFLVGDEGGIVILIVLDGLIA